MQRKSLPFQRAEVGGNGYLNFWLNRQPLASRLYHETLQSEPSREGKAIVEHTNINPNKAAHVGHLRNACLGDSLVRLLKFMGTPVETHNYIDDTGVQVADVVVGFLGREKASQIWIQFQDGSITTSGISMRKRITGLIQLLKEKRKDIEF